MGKMLKKILKIIGIVLAAVVAFAVLFILFLTVTEYRPADVEDAVMLASSDGSQAPSEGSTVSVLSWNIGYCGLGAGSDFFMDGGKNVASADKETVQKYLDGIAAAVSDPANQSDIRMFQEVDTDSSRSYHINETKTLAGANASFATNFSCAFIPYPIPPIGTVHSGLLNTTDFPIETSQRIALPCPFSWPVRLGNLKRCLLVNYIPLENSDKYLVSVDLHLEAYDDGSGKAAQTAKLKEFLASEYAKGNYVIAGGDFNQEFPGALDVYPNTHADLWSPGTLDESLIPDGFSFAYDTSTPSCRLNNQPYDPSDTADTQYYVIDGFILSPNVTLETVKTIDEGFADSDHNPVRLTAKLG